MKNVALILAGGQGSRLNSEIPKQYLKLDGIPILRISALKFLNHPEIHEVLIIIRQEDQELYKNAVGDLPLLPAVYGGQSRTESAMNGLRALFSLKPDNVLIHDAVRPFISGKIISQILMMLKENEAVDLGIKVNDTIKHIKDCSVIDRELLYATQTPQGFRFPLIYELHNKFYPQTFTDDISLVLEAGLKVGYLEGEGTNIKITKNMDLQLGEALMILEARKNDNDCKDFIDNTKGPRVGYGYDIHKFSEEENLSGILVMGAIAIPWEKKFIAHSDGDVVLHAMTDALLGAMGEEDIGMHFPPTKSEWKDKNSIHFLEFANNLLKQKGGRICNIDITIIAELPKLMPYKLLMREKIAEILKINVNLVSVKAKTAEKLGFVGREEGIAVSAVCMIII